MHQQERGGWVVINPDDDDDEPEEDDQDIRDKTLPRWQIWLAAERSRDQRHWRPWRPDKTKKQTEEDCDDPERQASTPPQEGPQPSGLCLLPIPVGFGYPKKVLFDDIGQSLIRLSSHALQFQLIVAFLQFLGVPAGFSPPASCLYLAMDENSIFDNGLYDEQPLTSLNLSFSGVSCVGRTDQLGCRRWTRGHSREGEEFIRNIFHLVMPLFSGTERSQLCSSWLRYEIAKVIWCLHTKNKKRLKSRGKNCKKLAKNLLKEPENRNNVCLWKQYAHLEWLLGNTEDARKVFDTALSSAGSGELKDPEVCELSLLYAELELELAPDTRVATAARAVHILTRLAESGPYGPYTGQVLAVHILKARKAYEHALQDCLGESCVSDPAATASLNRLVSVVKCFMLFQYLTIGIDAAVQIHEQVFAKLKGSLSPEGPGLEDQCLPPECEQRPRGGHTDAHEPAQVPHESQRLPSGSSAAGALRGFKVVSRQPGSLEVLRSGSEQVPQCQQDQEILRCSHQGLQKRPAKSSIFALEAFVAVCLGHAFWDPAPCLWFVGGNGQAFSIADAVVKAYGVDGREVYATIPETGLTHRIRALFENAIRSEHGSQCPLLWRMYLSFLALYMDAVEYFPDEMQEILDLMTEKELRVRLPLEELELLLED
ncbi:hypothetical protein QTO34_020106 [Cnephaeus nilssonii]|uniref:Protein NRDE2 homolog n=1 Tax=Cnephaeus nilssonii TaxID=3371016 RepID=A0AA40HXV7_CNENI|nr:hypothetical protein QTO34_020106 [Eptesicus nilssonii]